MSYYQTMRFLKKVFEKKNVVGCDLVELAPIKNLHAPDFMCSRIVYKMIGYKFKNYKNRLSVKSHSTKYHPLGSRAIGCGFLELS